MWNRWQDPDTGTFLSEDQAQDGGNWYVYGVSNPMTKSDPTGLESVMASYRVQQSEEARQLALAQEPAAPQSSFLSALAGYLMSQTSLGFSPGDAAASTVNGAFATEKMLKEGVNIAALVPIATIHGASGVMEPLG